MLPYSEKLRIHIAKRGLFKNDVAKTIGCTPVTISNMLHRGKKPQKRNADAIYDFTKGEISYQDMGYFELKKYGRIHPTYTYSVLPEFCN